MQIFYFADKAPHALYPEAAIIFLGLEQVDCSLIDDTFSSWSTTNVVPPTVIILGNISILKSFLLNNISSSGTVPELDRLGRKSVLIYAGFDHSGRVSKIEPSPKNGQAIDLTMTIHNAIYSFVEKQVEQEEIVIPAPPGFYFDKLSGRFSSHFIRTESLLTSTHHIELLALRLLRPFDEWYKNLSPTTSGTVKIFIDTMGIWPIAEKLSQMHRYGNDNVDQYVIESFKSYDGLNAWDPQRRPAFVLLSASTSGGLANKVKLKLSNSNAPIWTVLALAPDSVGDANPSEPSRDIYRIPRKLKGKPTLNGLRPIFETNLDKIPLGYETISIVGERFLNQSSKPKTVRLAQLSLSDPIKRTLRDLATQNVIKVGRGRFDAKSRWTLSFDYQKLFEHAGVYHSGDSEKSIFRSWLRNYASPGPIAIIYPSSSGPAAREVTDAAKLLAEQTQIILSELMSGVRISILSSEQLTKSSVAHAFPLSTCSVIVVSPVIGNGFAFKQISAQLRVLQPEGPRLYIALAALPETQARFKQLTDDITLATDNRLYQFKCKFAIPIGRLDTAVQWDTELGILEDLQTKSVNEKSFSEKINSRVTSLKALRILDDSNVFLPSIQDKPLFLSSGFFLWPDSTSLSGDNYQAAVLLTISALLQASRVATSKSEATSLKTGLFQHALICPESFTRYNDPAIQGAILRAAYPSELNYSVSPEASHDMERLLVKMIEYVNEHSGYAVAEFLMALASGKMKLCNTHMLNVVTAAEKISGWIGNLAKILRQRQLA